MEKVSFCPHTNGVSYRETTVSINLETLMLLYLIFSRYSKIFQNFWILLDSAGTLQTLIRPHNMYRLLEKAH